MPEPLNYDSLDLYSIDVLNWHWDFLSARADEAIDRKDWDRLEEINHEIRMIQDEINCMRRKTTEEILERRAYLIKVIDGCKGPWDNAKHMEDEVAGLQGDYDELMDIDWELKQRGQLPATE